MRARAQLRETRADGRVVCRVIRVFVPVRARHIGPHPSPRPSSGGARVVATSRASSSQCRAPPPPSSPRTTRRRRSSSCIGSSAVLVADGRQHDAADELGRRPRVRSAQDHGSRRLPTADFTFMTSSVAALWVHLHAERSRSPAPAARHAADKAARATPLHDTSAPVA